MPFYVYELPQPKGYRGSIRYIKSRTTGEIIYKIGKVRPYGTDKYTIAKDDFDWCDTYKRARSLWAFCHYYNTAIWFSGELKHPRTGESYVRTKSNSANGVHNGDSHVCSTNGL